MSLWPNSGEQSTSSFPQDKIDSLPGCYSDVRKKNSRITPVAIKEIKMPLRIEFFIKTPNVANSPELTPEWRTIDASPISRPNINEVQFTRILFIELTLSILTLHH